MCVAAAVAGAGLAGAAVSASASKSAANTQAGAARDAAALQQQQYEQTRTDLEPYRTLGTNNIPSLQSGIDNPILQQHFLYGGFNAPTLEQAQQTPGYQFTLQNGLKAAQNSASARGLGSSGAALKAASTYASGLADSTYNDVFNRAVSSYNTDRNNALGNFTTNYGIAADNVNRLLGVVGLGQNAAAQTGNAGAQASNSIAGTLTSGAAASAAGQVGSANAINNGISNAINGYQTNQLLNKLYQPSASSSGSTLYGNAYSGFDNPANYG